MQISPAKKEKLKANLGKREFVADLHPRYPKGHPKAGEFMPKGGADYVNAIAKNTGKTPAQVKASLSSDGAVKPSAIGQAKQESKLPSQAVSEIQSKVRAFNAEMENSMIRTRPPRSSAATAPKPTPQLNKKKTAVELALQKFGATKEKAAEIANKLISRFTQSQKQPPKPEPKLNVESKSKLRDAGKKVASDKKEVKPTSQVKIVSEYNPSQPLKSQQSKPVSWKDFTNKSESYLGKELEAFEKSLMKPEQIKAELAKWDKEHGVTEKLNKYKKALAKVSGEKAEQVKAQIKKLESAMEYKKELLEATGSPEATEALLKKIYPQARSPEAIALAKKVEISKDVSHHGKAFWQESMADFFALTNGKGSKSLKTLEKTSDRAFAVQPTGVINVGRDRTKEEAKRVLYHEAGHHLEFENPELLKAAKQFIKERGGTNQPKKLNAIIGEKRYRDNEIAYHDHFIDPYVGKIYASATEVISMGIEKFSDPVKLRMFIKKDREHFLLVHGAILK